MSNEGARKNRRPIVIALIAGVATLTTVVAVSSDDRDVAASAKARGASVSDRDDRPSSQTMAAGTSQRCLDALYEVESAGHELHDETEFRCPGSTGFTPESEQHWGATCWDTALCPRSSYVAISPAVIGPSDERLRYVIAHEICHVNSYARTGEPGSEPAADACAAEAGFPRV